MACACPCAPTVRAVFYMGMSAGIFGIKRACGKRFIIRAKGRIVLLWCIAGVLLCLLNLLFWSLEQVNVLFIAGLTAVLLCCLFPLHPFVVRYRRLQDPLPPGRRRGADGKKGGKTG